VYDKKKDLIYVYANEGKIQLLDSNLQHKGSLKGHSGPVLSVVLWNDKIFSGGTDKKLYIWNKTDRSRSIV